MNGEQKKYVQCIFLLLSLTLHSGFSHARDIAEIKADGVLRHIGVPYANFVTNYQQGEKDLLGGLDVELMRGFAKHLGVEYQYVKSTWPTMFTQLTGESAHYIDGQLVRGTTVAPIEGDIISNGTTVLQWRHDVVDFSDNYFPSAVWLVARADSNMTPIQPSDLLSRDIKSVKSQLKNKDVLAMKQTCLDPDLYELHTTDANIIFPQKKLKLNEMIPAILNNDAESTLLDVADTLIALQKWPGEIKVIGPISEPQDMAVAFRKTSPQLRMAFNTYLRSLKSNGTYNLLVEKYYPSVFHYYPTYFVHNG